MADKAELEFKRYVRKHWPHWSCAYEPGIGGNDGYPDLQLMCPKTLKLLPVELKVGEFDGTRVFPRHVRGTQTVWHHEFAKAGGRSVLLVGVRSGSDWVAYAFPGTHCEIWREGYNPLGRFMMRPSNFQYGLEAMVSHFVGPVEPCQPSRSLL